MKKVIILLFTILILTGCSLKKETWQGFYYPNGCLECQEDYIFSPIFEDRASCLSWATTLRQERQNYLDEFECGKNCKVPETKDGFYICDETVDY